MRKLTITWVSPKEAFAFAVVSTEVVPGIESELASGSLRITKSFKVGESITLPENVTVSTTKYEYVDDETGEIKQGTRLLLQ